MEAHANKRVCTQAQLQGDLQTKVNDNHQIMDGQKSNFLCVNSHILNHNTQEKYNTKVIKNHCAHKGEPPTLKMVIAVEGILLESDPLL